MSQAPPDLPLRLGALDVGSNAIRFLAVEFGENRRSQRLDSARAPIRLGHDAFGMRKLSEQMIEAAVEVMCDYRRRMDALEITHYRAVATSAVRDSANGDELIHRVHIACGLELEPITGPEEARLVWRAVRSTIEMKEGRWILVDVGGGSVEVSLITRDGVAWIESHALGTVRLLEELAAETERSPARDRRLLEERLTVLRTKALLGEKGHVVGVIGTGGNAEALADLGGRTGASHSPRELRTDALRQIVRDLSVMDVAERMRQFDLRADRADVIVPAAMIYEQIARLVGSDRILVPDVGLRDGVVLDLLDDLREHGEHERLLEAEITSSALALGRHYGFEEPHAVHVAKLAMSLFDQLSAFHELGDPERRVLLAAALLHDIGQIVSYRRHHKHSQYLIANAEIAGLSPREIAFTALLARYHRGAAPLPGHDEYGALSPAHQEQLAKLAALLRLADALDRGHQQRVIGLTATPTGDTLLLEVEGEEDLAPEEWALGKKGRLFTELFGLSPRLLAVGSSAHGTHLR